MKNAIDDSIKIINDIRLTQQNQWVKKQPHSHSIVNKGQNTSNGAALVSIMPFDTIKNTMLAFEFVLNNSQSIRV